MTTKAMLLLRCHDSLKDAALHANLMTRACLMGRRKEREEWELAAREVKSIDIDYKDMDAAVLSLLGGLVRAKEDYPVHCTWTLTTRSVVSQGATPDWVKSHLCEQQFPWRFKKARRDSQPSPCWRMGRTYK